MNTVYLVRHGENIANLTHEFSHKVIDYSLTPKGILQAQQTAEFFKDKDIHEIYASPLKRAQETATIIAQALHLPITTIEELREVNIGNLELQPPTEANWKLHNIIVANWFMGRQLDVAFPGGENYLQLLQRIRGALSKIVEGKDGRNIAVVGHGGIFTIPLYDICSDVDRTTLIKKENNNCSVTRIGLALHDGQLAGTLQEWALCSHLSGDAAKFVAGNPYPKKF